MNYSKHAKDRNQQRCIPPIVHAWLDDYGRCKFDGQGACIVYFDKSGIRRMEKELGKQFVRENKKYWRIYRVESNEDSSVITCGHRYKRIFN